MKHFEESEDPIAEDESPEEMLAAESPEDSTTEDEDEEMSYVGELTEDSSSENETCEEYEPSEDTYEDLPDAEPPEDLIVEDGSHEEIRYAGLFEVVHTGLTLTLHNWENCWKPKRFKKRPSKGHLADSIFFDPFICAPKSRLATAEQ
jgi:hypothetical protein